MQKRDANVYRHPDARTEGMKKTRARHTRLDATTTTGGKIKRPPVEEEYKGQPEPTSMNQAKSWARRHRALKHPKKHNPNIDAKRKRKIQERAQQNYKLAKIRDMQASSGKPIARNRAQAKSWRQRAAKLLSEKAEASGGEKVEAGDIVDGEVVGQFSYLRNMVLLALDGDQDDIAMLEDENFSSEDIKAMHGQSVR
jgi:FKBP-type peptidyl-prolyl cis-trans isomerase